MMRGWQSRRSCATRRRECAGVPEHNAKSVDGAAVVSKSLGRVAMPRQARGVWWLSSSALCG